MSGAEIALIVIGVLLIIALVVIRAAIRLDRLHRRLDSGIHAVDAQLRQRAAAARDLATSRALETASGIIVADIAARNQYTEAILNWDDPSVLDTRAQAESELTIALRTALGERDDQLLVLSQAREEFEKLVHATFRVRLARQMFNDAVGSVLRIRHKVIVRLLYLAGPTPMPLHFDMDDDLMLEIEVT